MSDVPPPPQFESREAFREFKSAVEFWKPYIDITVADNGLTLRSGEVEAGFNSTYPTFIAGDLVIKFLGHLNAWRQVYDAERTALERVAADPDIPGPELLGHGFLLGDLDTGWAWLATRRMPGQALWRLLPDRALHERIAIALAEILPRIHALPPQGIPEIADWTAIDLTSANRNSSLPEHLVEQVPDYVRTLGPPDPAFINADIVANHVYVEGGNLTGILDWGDAVITDRHVELIQIYRDTLRCDRALFRTFLEVSQWPVGPDFPRKALGYALCRQGLRRIQNQGGGDVFEPIAEAYPLERIATLDELAEILFDVWSPASDSGSQ